MKDRRQSEPSAAAWECFLAICGEAGGEAFTHQAQQRLGLHALAHLVYRMENGCPRAAKEIADRCLGVPEMPFSVRTEGMNTDEVRAELIQRYMRGWGWDRATAEAKLDEMSAAPAEGAKDEDGDDGDG